MAGIYRECQRAIIVAKSAAGLLDRSKSIHQRDEHGKWRQLTRPWVAELIRLSSPRRLVLDASLLMEDVLVIVCDACCACVLSALAAACGV